MDQWSLAPASHCDGKLTPSLFAEASHLWVDADNAFHDPDAKAWLDKQRQIVLATGQ